VSDPSSRKRGLPLRVKMRHDNHFVEELSARHETSIGKMVPLSSIEPDPNQPRTAMGDLAELVSSIRAKGVLEPILARPRTPETATPSGVLYRIISGERRYRAAQEAGLYEVPLIVMDVSEEEALEIALIENLQRKDLTPFEEAEGYRALAERHEYTHEEIASSVGKSRSVITESLQLLTMPTRAREAVQALGVGSRSLLLEVLKAGTEQEMIKLLEEVSRRGLSRDDLRDRMRKEHGKAKHRKPYVFRFKAPDKTYSLALTFRQSAVDSDDLIQALEQILRELRDHSSKQSPS
jgi:ParB family chromosome partitioning protein